MLLKQKIKSKNRIQIFVVLGPIAWIALMLNIFLGRLENPTLDFATGFLVGISIVGNLAYIYVVTRHMRENRRQI
jgi:hypothetical protein